MFFEYLSLYCIKLYICITTSVSFALSVWVLFISLMLSVVHGAQFLNINPLFISPVLFEASSAPTPVIV